MSILRILGFSGSLRRNSANTAILETLVEMLADRAVMTLFPLHEVPLYNQDLDTDMPPDAVAALRRAIAQADALIIASPEYNHGVPGLLKNALDWASRPHGKGSLRDKPVLTITSAPGALGGVRAQAQLNETLHATGSHVPFRPQAVVPLVQEKIVGGRLGHAPTLQFLLAAVDSLLAAVPSKPALRDVA